MARSCLSAKVYTAADLPITARHALVYVKQGDVCPLYRYPPVLHLQGKMRVQPLIHAGVHGSSQSMQLGCTISHVAS